MLILNSCKDPCDDFELVQDTSASLALSDRTEFDCLMHSFSLVLSNLVCSNENLKSALLNEFRDQPNGYMPSLLLIQLKDLQVGSSSFESLIDSELANSNLTCTSEISCNNLIEINPLASINLNPFLHDRIDEILDKEFVVTSVVSSLNFLDNVNFSFYKGEVLPFISKIPEFYFDESYLEFLVSASDHYVLVNVLNQVDFLGNSLWQYFPILESHWLQLLDEFENGNRFIDSSINPAYKYILKTDMEAIKQEIAYEGVSFENEEVFPECHRATLVSSSNAVENIRFNSVANWGSGLGALGKSSLDLKNSSKYLFNENFVERTINFHMMDFVVDYSLTLDEMDNGSMKVFVEVSEVKEQSIHCEIYNDWTMNDEWITVDWWVVEYPNSTNNFQFLGTSKGNQAVDFCHENGREYSTGGFTFDVYFQ